MKTFSFWIIIFSLSFSGLAGNKNVSPILEQQCLFPPLVEGEDWDVFWAQHLIGADLLRQELKKPDIMEDGPVSVVGAWDSDWHGEVVSNIIAGPHQSAVIPMNDPLSFQEVISETFYSEDDIRERYKKLYEECRQNKNCPSYINNSMAWGNNNTIIPLVASMSVQGVTLVTAAQNSPRLIPSGKREASFNKTALVVASLTPDGSPSEFTSYGEGVTISAPSDNSIRSYDYSGEAVSFGGTSGAAPLVTGVLGGFSLISKYHLSTYQADLLLRKTAIPLPNLPRKHLMGEGVLNAYKVGMVALRIKERCKSYTTKTRRNRCLFDSLENDETYRFDETGAGLFEEAMNSFPECVTPRRRPKKSIKNDCKRTEAFNNLRRASLLNPTDTKMLNAVICVKEKHFEGKGTPFYRSLLESLQKNDDEIIEDICKNEQRALWARYLPKSLLIDWIGQNKCSLKFLEVALISLINHSSSLESIKDILAHPNVTEDVLLQALENIDRIPNAEGLLDTILSHSDITSYVLGKAAYRGVEWVSSNHQKFIERILNHPKSSEETVTEVIYTILDHSDSFFDTPQKYIEKILDHSKVTGRVLGSLFSEVINNNINNHTKFFNPQRLIEMIFDHDKFDNNALISCLEKVVNNAKKISNYQELLGKIFTHSKIDEEMLDSFSSEITSDDFFYNEVSDSIKQGLLEKIEEKRKSLK